MKRIVEISICYPAEPVTAVFPVKQKMTILPWIKCGPFIQRVDGSGITRNIIDGMHLIAGLKQSSDHVASNKTGCTGNKYFAHSHKSGV